ncbi:hypothetical protein [Candidatus Leptofilum sp.]
MNRWIWKTAVALIVLLFTAVSCGSSDAEPAAVPEVTGPAFVLFYTDN